MKKNKNVQKYYEEITPLREFMQVFNSRKKSVIIAIIISFIVGTMLSGLLYQYIMYAFGDLKEIYIVSSFSYGLKDSFFVTILMSLAVFYIYYIYVSSLIRGKKDYENGIIRSDNNTFGRAHFQSDEEIEKNFEHTKTIESNKGDILGINPSTGEYLSLIFPPGKPHNYLFVGPPGTGKSSAIIKTFLYQQLARGESVILIDSKGDIYRDTIAAVREKYNPVIKVFNSKDFENSNAWNFMTQIDCNRSDFATTCEKIAREYIKNTMDGTDESYFSDMAQIILTTGIMLFCSRPEYADKRDIYHVYEFFNQNTVESIRDVMKSVPKNSAVRMQYDNWGNLPDQLQNQLLGEVKKHLTRFNNEELKEISIRNEIDPILPMKRQCVYYVIISDNDTTYRFLGGLFFSMLIKSMSDYSDTLTDKSKQLVVNLLADEYKNIGGINNLDSIISTVRSRKIYLTIILQAIGQLETLHGETKAHEIINGCPVKGLLGCDDLDTATWFCDLLGTFTAITENEGYEERAADTAKLHNQKHKGRSETGIPLIRPEDLMNSATKTDDVYYQINSMDPVKLKKCFAEKFIDGKSEALHPMEKRGRELGQRLSTNYLPKWRKEKLEQEAQKAKEKAEKLNAIKAGAENIAEEPKKEPESNVSVAPVTPEKPKKPVIKKTGITLTRTTL